MMKAILLGVALGLLPWASAARGAAADPVERIVLLPPGDNNPRNSEGDFVRLRSGRLLFVYSHFTGRSSSDHASAHLAARWSDDAGRTWSAEDQLVVPNEGGINVMSVSLLRLHDGRIALFYLQKNSLADCRPRMRISVDEAQSWGPPVLCVGQVGYYVMNNDRAVQLASGRLVLPVCIHVEPTWPKTEWEGRLGCYLSDDTGRTWRRSKSVLTTVADGKRVTTQEPGVIELNDGRLMMFCRTRSGSQWISYSTDGGDTWSPAAPSNIVSPCSPATIERVPASGELILVWNDHQGIAPELQEKRTPLAIAVSRDEGKTWQNKRVLENDPDAWYCYTALEFVDGHILLGHCAGNRAKGTGLSVTQITRVPLAWLLARDVEPSAD